MGAEVMGQRAVRARGWGRRPVSLRQMEYLVTVIEQASFTRAAETLHVTQSALSHQIKALEREVGGPLLERLPRGVRLTPMGRAFLPDAELAVRSARQARRAARAAAGVSGGELEIATVHGLAVGVLAEAVARMRRLHPQVTLRLREYVTEEELRERMARGIADVAVGYQLRDWSGPSWEIGEEQIVLVVPPDDPLCARAGGDEPVALAELADRGWVRCGMEPWIDGRPFLDLVCGRAGFVPRTAVRVEHPTTAARMAAAGAGICLVSAHLAPSLVPPGQLVPCGPPWRRPLTAFCRSEPTGAAEAFIALLRGEARRAG